MNNLGFLGSTKAQEMRRIKNTDEENQTFLKEERNKNPGGWIDLKSVENKIIELEKERDKTTNKQKKAQYDFLLSKYQVQCKKLLQKRAEEQSKKGINQTTKNNRNTEIIEIDQDEDGVVTGKTANEQNKPKRKARDQIISEKENGDSKEMNKTQRLKSPQKDNNDDNKNSNKEQAETTNANNNKKQENEQTSTNKLTYKDIAKLKLEEEKKKIRLMNLTQLKKMVK